MGTAGQWCNHDTPAIGPDGTCECRARVRAFPTPEALAEFLSAEWSFSPAGAKAIADGLDRGHEPVTIPVDVHGTSVDHRTLARVGGWYLVIPYRTDEAIRRAG
jgi:hypothetical protein